MKTLIAIPALNEELTIKKLISSIPPEIHNSKVSVLVIDDGSTDSTVKEAEEAGSTVISHGRNMGLGAVFRTMLSYARENGFHIMATLDADGQFNPQDLPTLIKPIVNNTADFVTASRFKDPEFIPKMPAIKIWGNARVAKLVSSLAKIKVYDATCGYRVYGPKALERVSCFSRFTYTQEVLIDLARPWKFYGGPAFSLLAIGFILDTFTLSWWLATGRISPFTAYGIGGLFSITFGILLLLFASIADISASKLLQWKLEELEINYSINKPEYSIF